MFLLISDYACIDEGRAFPVAGKRGEFVFENLEQ